MSFVHSIKLKTKLFAIVGFLIGLTAIICVSTYSTLDRIAALTAEAQESSARMQNAGRATANLLAYVRNVEFLPLEMTPPQREEYEKAAEDEFRRMSARLDQFKPFAEAGVQELKRIRESMARYREDIHLPVQRMAREKELEKAGNHAFSGVKMVDDVRQLLRSLEDRNLKRLAEQSELLTKEQQSLLHTLLVLGIAGALLGIASAYAGIVLGVTKPLGQLTATMQNLADGKTNLDVPGVERGDEVGVMARTVETFRENAQERARLEQRAVRERDMEVQRQQHTDTLIKQFRTQIEGIRSVLDLQLNGMKDSAESLTRIANDASSGASSAQAATHEASSNVGNVANAAGELTAASREISTQVHKASECVTRAMRVAKEADEGISSLAELADRIGAIVHMINGIAEQTNMLALNATIEAARAGEAGRSFAVVASEVKTLAGQTAKATDEISTQISAIQSSTVGAVELIRTISESVGEIEGRTTAIAAAVEEQEASTHEISRAISLASSGSNRVATDVTSMARSVEMTSDEANALRATTDRLAEIAGELSRSVDSFLDGVTKDVADRRNAVRRATREVVLITHGKRRKQTRALDVSETGLRIEYDEALPLQDPLEIEFLNGERAKAKVMWCANGQAGLMLDQRIPQMLVDAMAA